VESYVYILSGFLIFGCILVLAYRILVNSGLLVSENPLAKSLLADYSLSNSGNVSNKEAGAVFLIALGFRIMLFLLGAAFLFMFGHVASFEDILEQYIKWDAHAYQRIATGGYTYFTEYGDYVTLAFFPLYPWLMRVVNFIFCDLRISGFVVSYLCYAGGCSFLYKLFSIDYGKDTAKRAIIYLSVFPHSLFFGALMSESLMLFTMAATLYYIRKHNWWLVGVFGALAALSRMTGILLAIPAAVEWIEHYKIVDKFKNKKIGDIWKLFYQKGLWIFFMLAGTGLYLLCNFKVTNNCFTFLEYQRTYWHHGAAYFGKGILCVFENLVSSFSEKPSIFFELWLPSAMSILFVLAMMIYGLRRNRSMYSAFLIVYFMINMGVDWIISTPRYMACAVPAFLFLADFSERRKWTEPFITATMAVGLGLYLVAYLSNKQVL